MAGKHGGYCLRRDPTDVSLLDVVRATESNGRREQCVLRDAPCDADPSCPLHAVLGTAEASYTGVLAGTSLADLASRQRAIHQHDGHDRPERTER
jgi:Rrf2 family protein